MLLQVEKSVGQYDTVQYVKRLEKQLHRNFFDFGWRLNVVQSNI